MSDPGCRGLKVDGDLGHGSAQAVGLAPMVGGKGCSRSLCTLTAFVDIRGDLHSRV